MIKDLHEELLKRKYIQVALPYQETENKLIASFQKQLSESTVITCNVYDVYNDSENEDGVVVEFNAAIHVLDDKNRYVFMSLSNFEDDIDFIEEYVRAMRRFAGA